MNISPDAIIYWQHAAYPWLKLNATIVFTWGIMLVLALGSWLATRGLSSGPEISHWQNLLESIVAGLRSQIAEVTKRRPSLFMPLIGTLFVFIAFSNLLTIVPFYHAPTGSLSTTAALAICVFVAVPVYGIADQGFKTYLAQYLKPTPIMLPFNVISDFSRTLALAVRLFGNIMSGAMIAGILLAVAPLILPVVMNLFGLLTGMVQAYIFTVLAAVYIASGMRTHEQIQQQHNKE